MPATYTYPGVYVEEIPSGVRTIVGVSTSDTAFVDFFKRGSVDKAVRITSWGDFEREFGGLDSRSEASYAIWQYYRNGGSITWVVRVVADNASAAERTLASAPSYYGYGYSSYGGESGESLKVIAANPGDWGNNLQVAVDHVKDLSSGQITGEFNLVVREVEEAKGRLQVKRSEIFRNLSLDLNSSRFAETVVQENSTLIRLQALTLGGLPEKTGEDVINDPQEEDKETGDPGSFRWLGRPSESGVAGYDGYQPESDNWKQSAGSEAILGSEKDKTGLYALEKIAPYIFNLLCIPAASKLADNSMSSVINDAIKFCLDKRAFMLVDIPEGVKKDDMATWLEDNNITRESNAAVYFPRLEIPDPLNEFRLRNVGVSGTLAGVYARTDSERGVWKAPAGIEAALRGANLELKLTDLENGALNPLGINILRNFPIYGNVSWGARTLEGADQLASEWKYIPVRRMALYIEESLFQGLKWVVFEPNDEPLWAQIRLNVGAFMQNLFRQGAFQGKSPRDAYFVKCDKETTTQNDINLGIVNIVVGFAPLKPAEFVIIKLQQIAGQVET